MDEDEEIQSQDDGGYDSPDNDDDLIDPDLGTEQSDDDEPQSDDDEPITIEDIAPLKLDSVGVEEIDDLAGEYGVSRQTMLKTLGALRRTMTSEIQSVSVSNSILRQQVTAVPGIAKIVPDVEAELSKIDPQFRGNKPTVLLAMANSYIKNLKPGETWAHLVRRMAADAGVSGARPRPQPEDTTTRVVKPKGTPAPTVSGGRSRPSGQPAQRGKANESFAMRLLKSKYGESAGAANWDQIEREVGMGIR